MFSWEMLSERRWKTTTMVGNKAETFKKYLDDKYITYKMNGKGVSTVFECLVNNNETEMIIDFIMSM